MSTFTVKIDTNNDAFAPDPALEITRILREIADTVEAHGCSGFFETIFDGNGNDVGRFAHKKGE